MSLVSGADHNISGAYLLPRAVPFPPLSPVATATLPWAAARGAARSAKAKILLIDGKNILTKYDDYILECDFRCW
jgi:hypothetical protein